MLRLTSGKSELSIGPGVTCARAEAGLSYLSEMEGEAPHATNNPKATWRFMEIWQEVGGRRPELSGRDSTCYTKTDG
jgi:hypothetical protein